MHPLTVADVRFYIMDRGSADNSIPPLGVDVVNPACLPSATNLFLDGTAAVLLRMELLRRGRNDVDYQLAGASASTEATRINHIKEEVKMMQERFQQEAVNRKLTLNTYSYFGPIV